MDIQYYSIQESSCQLLPIFLYLILALSKIRKQKIQGYFISMKVPFWVVKVQIEE